MTDYPKYIDLKPGEESKWKATDLIIPVRVSAYEKLLQGREAHTDPRTGTLCPILADIEVNMCNHCGWNCH